MNEECEVLHRVEARSTSACILPRPCLLGEWGVGLGPDSDIAGRFAVGVTVSSSELTF